MKNIQLHLLLYLSDLITKDYRIFPYRLSFNTRQKRDAAWVG